MREFVFIDVNDPAARRKAKISSAQHAARKRTISETGLEEVEQQEQQQHGDSSARASEEPAQRTNSSSEGRGRKIPLPLIDFGDQTQRSRPVLEASGENARAVTRGSELEQAISKFDLNPTSSRISLGAFGVRLSKLNLSDQNLMRRCKSFLLVHPFRTGIRAETNKELKDLSEYPEMAYRVPLTSELNPFRIWTYECVSEGVLSLFGHLLHASTIYDGSDSPSLYHQVASPRFADRRDASGMNHRGRVVGLVNAALRDPKNALSDDMIYAIYCLVHVDNRLGEMEVFSTRAHAHSAGLRRILRLRGGLEALGKNRPLCAAIANIELSLIKWPNASSIAAETLPTPHQKTELDIANEQERVQEYQSFVWVLVMLQLQTYKLRDTLKEGPRALDARKSSTPEADRGSSRVLFDLLTPAEEGEFTTIPTIQFVRNFQMACLFYLNCTIAEIPTTSVENRSVFLEAVSRQASQCRVHANSAMLLLNVFLRDMGPAETQTACRLIRVMRVVRRLSTTTVQLLHTTMLRQLTMNTLDESAQQLRDLREVWSLVESDYRE